MYAPGVVAPGVSPPKTASQCLKLKQVCLLHFPELLIVALCILLPVQKNDIQNLTESGTEYLRKRPYMEKDAPPVTEL